MKFCTKKHYKNTLIERKKVLALKQMKGIYLTNDCYRDAGFLVNVYDDRFLDFILFLNPSLLS